MLAPGTWIDSDKRASRAEMYCEETSLAANR